ncbi:MAG TPA: hypothetical protein VI815_03570 [Candidatus Nanoarchaeia archaeon]|nr:hypothetical protein [Candidatus Nanoarchaeia archaeon]
MQILERYSKLLEALGEDPAQIVTSIEKHNKYNEVPYAHHELRHEFDIGRGDYTSLNLTEDTGVTINREEVEKRPFSERSLSRNTQLEPDHYWLGLNFCYENVLLEAAVELYFDGSGKIMFPGSASELSSFEIEEDAGVLKVRFKGINTSVGADFEPVAKAMVHIYQSMKEKPGFYAQYCSRKIT